MAAQEALGLARRASTLAGGPVYNLACACACAQCGEIDEALSILEELDKGGQLKNLEWLGKDPDRGPLRARPRFEALLRGATAASG